MIRALPLLAWIASLVVYHADVLAEPSGTGQTIDLEGGSVNVAVGATLSVADVERTLGTAYKAVINEKTKPRGVSKEIRVSGMRLFFHRDILVGIEYMPDYPSGTPMTPFADSALNPPSDPRIRAGQPIHVLRAAVEDWKEKLSAEGWKPVPSGDTLREREFSIKKDPAHFVGIDFGPCRVIKTRCRPRAAWWFDTFGGTIQARDTVKAFLWGEDILPDLR